METNKIFICPDCGAVCNVEDGVEIDGELYCPDCVVECWNCGEWIRREDAIENSSNGELYCPDCADNYLCWCEYCGRYVDNDNIVPIYNNSNYYRRGREANTWVCPDCADEHYHRCADCGDYFDEELTETRNGDCVCNSCLDDDYAYCENCEEWVTLDEYAGDGRCCNCCGSDFIGQYHTHRHFTRYGLTRKQWGGIWRGVGIELEIDRPDADAYAEEELVADLQALAGDEVYFEHDCSLSNGFEIITEPHTVDALYNMPWEAMLEACSRRGYTSHDAETCGLHIHFSREMFGANENLQGVAIAKLIKFYDDFYPDCVKISRRSIDRAEQWAASYNTQDRKEAEEYGKRKKRGDKGRYYAINNSNTNTVEIRLTRGTLNYNSFMACIDFMITVVKNSRRIAWKNIDNVALWLKGCAPDTLKYIKNRGAFPATINKLMEVYA